MQAIENMMQSAHAPDAHHLLMWLTFAFEPLSTEQCCEILDVDVEQQNIYPSDQEDFKLDLIIDSNLVTVDANNIVQLAHASVKEFLLEGKNWGKGIRLFQIDELLAHATLGKVCIIYLLSRDNSIGDKWGKAIDNYASTYWEAHTRQVQEAGPERDLDNLSRIFLDEHSGAFQKWTQCMGANPLYLASISGLIRSVWDLIDRGKDVNTQGGRYGNALQGASKWGNEAIVQLLVSNGADINAQGGKFGNALQAAVISGNEAIVQILLTNGADMNAQGGKYGNALQAATEKGNEAIVQLLLSLL